MVALATSEAANPTAVDADRDGAFVAFIDVNGDGKRDHADIGVEESIYDCDDLSASIGPEQIEVEGDGLDNDCDGLDNVCDDTSIPCPMTDRKVARYLAHSGTKSREAFFQEYSRCQTSAECEVDDDAGTLRVVTAAVDTHAFVDLYFGESKVLRRDGIREVVTLEEVSHQELLDYYKYGSRKPHVTVLRIEAAEDGRSQAETPSINDQLEQMIILLEEERKRLVWP